MHGAYITAPKDCIRIEDGCPAIVDRETFETVQKRLSENRKKGGRPLKYDVHPLTGKIFFGECGSAMNISYSGSSRQYAYYDCAKKHRQHTCSAAPINKEALAAAIASAVREMFTDHKKVTVLANTLRIARDSLQAAAAPQMLRMIKAGGNTEETGQCNRRHSEWSEQSGYPR